MNPQRHFALTDIKEPFSKSAKTNRDDQEQDFFLLFLMAMLIVDDDAFSFDTELLNQFLEIFNPLQENN